MDDEDDFQDKDKGIVLKKIECKKFFKCLGCRESFSAKPTLLTHLRKYKRCRAVYNENEYTRLLQEEDFQTKNTIQDETKEQVIFKFST